jgi:hypothetical protein
VEGDALLGCLCLRPVKAVRRAEAGLLREAPRGYSLLDLIGTKLVNEGAVVSGGQILTRPQIAPPTLRHKAGRLTSLQN